MVNTPEPNEDEQTLRDFLMPKARPDHQFSSKSIGKRLKQHIDNPVCSGERVLVLRSWQDTHTRMNVYSVRDITP